MSPVIPARVVELLRGPAVMHVGTRDRRLRPAHSHVTGAIVDDDLRTVTFFVTETRAKRVLSDVEDNGRVALTAAQATHEAYQLKGSYVSSRPATEADYAFQEAYRNRLWPAIAQFFPEDVVRPMVLGTAYRPSVAITFRVEHIFEQTPGPGAGEEIA